MASKWLNQLANLFRFDPIGKIPLASIDTGFFCVANGLTLFEAYSNPEKSFFARLKGEKQFKFAPLPQIIRHTLLGAHDFGGDVRLPTTSYDQAMKVVSYPIKHESEVINLELPNPKTAGGIPTAMEFAELQHGNGSIVWFHHRSPFTMAANICGMEQFARWMIKKPELCNHLIQMALNHIFNVLDYWIETFKSENIAVYNSSPMESNHLISPLHFERFALPSHQKYIERLNLSGIKRYFFHICGYQARNLPHLSKIAPFWPHPTIVSIGHETDIIDAASFFPNDIIYGNIDPRLVQSGTPKSVYDICRKTLEKGKQLPNGFILALGCDLPVSCPYENVLAMSRALENLG